MNTTIKFRKVSNGWIAKKDKKTAVHTDEGDCVKDMITIIVGDLGSMKDGETYELQIVRIYNPPSLLGPAD